MTLDAQEVKALSEIVNSHPDSWDSNEFVRMYGHMPQFLHKLTVLGLFDPNGVY